MNERKFGYQIKRQLNRALDLEPAVLNRLKIAREQALAHQRVTQPVFALAWADNVFARLPRIPAAASVALAGAALIIAFVSMHYWQRTPSVEDIEEIDAAILTSDLPINAYLDKSFDSWLKRSPS
ncbi:MAG: DUF3619 family protein [Burkholderiales bacterium]